MTTWQAVGAIVGIIFAAVGAETATFRWLSRLGERVTKLEADNETFWRVFEPHMAAIIHQPSTPRRDILADRLMASEPLTAEELVELIALLRTCAQDVTKDKGARITAAMMEGRAAVRLRNLQEKCQRHWWQRRSEACLTRQ